ncbi:MAG TPA: hypothetical protein VM598_11825 [Bdellovibrionota bacterium]|nr:hypothetical protein [Bdellovibrionota bacterium]
MRALTWIAAAALFPGLWLPLPALGWYEHKHLIPHLLEGLDLAQQSALNAPLPPLCGSAEASAVQAAIAAVELNPRGKYGPGTPDACQGSRPTNGAELLKSGATDEPDNGMDENLPDSLDPKGARAHIGGKEGSSSDAFRHIYFANWSPLHPIRTLHQTWGELGEGRERARVMAEYARKLMKAPEPQRLPAFRALAWAFHYVQDLGQPFHAAALPTTEMVPWYALWTWPPGRAFSELMSETERSVTNYHWALEGYVRYRFMSQDKSVENPLAECVSKPDAHATLDRGPWAEPLPLATAVARASSELAPELGEAAVAFFGRGLMNRGHDFTKGAPQPSYQELSLRPDLVEARSRLHAVVCRSLANGAWASRWLIGYVLGEPGSR